MFLLALCIFALLGAMLLSALCTWCVRNIARKNHWVKGPESDRHVHSSPIPRLGGVAVYCTFIALIFFETALVSFGLHLHRAVSTSQVLHILMPATLMFLAGLADDFFGLRPLLKLGLQIASGFWLFELGCRVGIVGVQFHGTDYSTVLSCTATVAWVVMLSNAFNLIDGLDGLAAGASVFPLLTFSAVAVFHHNGQMAVASIILTGALLGFLRFNFNPATIFLGDCGSLFLGFMLAALSLAGTGPKAPTLLSVALPVVACGLPIAETFVSVARRFLSGHPIFSADREHFHHRLLKLGFTHRQVVILLFGVSGVCSLMSVILLSPRMNVLTLVATALCLLIFIGVGKLEYPEFEEISRVLLRVREQKVVIAQNVKVRHIATALRHVASWEDVIHVLRAGFQDADFSDFELCIYDRGAYGSSRGGLIYARSVALRPDYGDVKWSLTLEFMGDDEIGHLALRCPYKQKSLMMDVNVLLQVLKPALCSACRTIAGEQRILVLSDERAAATSAWDPECGFVENQFCEACRQEGP
jgi:UDP-GlcNAc:undecaprenyl-phosphate GlcNAc-1-phosphate transferase